MTLNDNNTKKSLSFQLYVTKINEKKNPGTNELHDFQNIPIARINSFIEALYSAGKIFHYKKEGKMGDVCDGVVSRLLAIFWAVTLHVFFFLQMRLVFLLFG